MLRSLKPLPVRPIRRYEDINEFTAWYIRKGDGRRYIDYQDAEGRKHVIYRYRWIWEQANGSIPDDREIHHIDGDCTNDGISNLEALTESEHHERHRARYLLLRPKTACGVCGALFPLKKRSKTRIQLFCGKQCGYIGREIRRDQRAA